MNTKKKCKRRVFGRLKRIDVGSKLFTFELVKDEFDKDFNVIRRGGVNVRQVNHHRVERVTFDRLTNGAGFEHGGAMFTLTEKGLEVRVKGSRRVRIVPYGQLLNMSGTQPLLAL